MFFFICFTIFSFKNVGSFFLSKNFKVLHENNSVVIGIPSFHYNYDNQSLFLAFDAGMKPIYNCSDFSDFLKHTKSFICPQYKSCFPFKILLLFYI